MKKFFVYLMTAFAVVAFNACSDDDPVTEEPITDTSETPDNADESGEPSGAARNILIAYFSWSGNTQAVAERISELTGGTLYRIEPAVPYPTDYTACTEVALEERDTNARPEIATSVENMDQYDTVFIGCPVWWHTAPMIISTFTESYDFTDKTVIPFCTYASTYRDETLARIVELTPGATHLAGWGVSGRNTDGVEAWLREIGILENEES